jgi:hypothetical protein
MFGNMDGILINKFFTKTQNWIPFAIHYYKTYNFYAKSGSKWIINRGNP